MAESFLGEIRLFSGKFPPKGWALCDGQVMAIIQNQELFSLLGTTYGGNGMTTFALPDLRGRTPVHVGAGVIWGQVGGEESHTLTLQEIPSHTHQVSVSSSTATDVSPANHVWAAKENSYGALNLSTTMYASALTQAGGSQRHNNMQPYLVLNFIICVSGIYPSRN
ncbi:phage tail protein [Brevibacillus ginsengisoli]|uniref:phage tail protein n=1 Tax=Brevibacillus ginsengisoli TaxID=363854 RepID=UPI003CEE7215